MFAATGDKARVAASSLAMLPGLFVLAAALAEPALAQQKETQPFEVSIQAIRATKTHTKVSPELRQIASELKKRFSYTGFTLEAEKSGQATKEKAYSADLVAGFKAKVTPLERSGERVTLKVEILQREGKTDKRLLSTTVTINRGKSYLQGGWRIDSKSADVLIVAVSAR